MSQLYSRFAVQLHQRTELYLQAQETKEFAARYTNSAVFQIVALQVSDDDDFLDELELPESLLQSKPKHIYGGRIKNQLTVRATCSLFFTLRMQQTSRTSEQTFPSTKSVSRLVDQRPATFSAEDFEMEWQ